MNLENHSAYEQIPPLIEDKEEAHAYIYENYEKGERPIVTVPIQFADAIKTGLKEHSTWIPGLDVIAGTFGRKPYIPSGESRLIIKIKSIHINQIHPRFTGPQKAFQGIVILDGPIDPDAIEVIH